MSKDRRADVLDMISADMTADAVRFDGRPLDGRAMGEIHGTLAAAISAVAGVVRTLLPAEQPASQVWEVRPAPANPETLLEDRDGTIWRRCGPNNDDPLDLRWEVDHRYLNRSRDRETWASPRRFAQLVVDHGPVRVWVPSDAERLAAEPETAARIDGYLADPSSGAFLRRPLAPEETP